MTQQAVNKTQSTVAKTLDSNVAKWFIRGLTGILLIGYGFLFLHSRVVYQKSLEISGDEWVILGFSFASWVAFEVLRSVFVGIAKKKGLM